MSNINLNQSQQQDNASLGELISRMSSDLSDLVRQEVELAKVETKEEVSKLAKGGSKIGAGAFAGYLAAVLASFALASLLDNWMQTELAFFLVAVAYGIAAAVLVQRGKEQLQTINPVPEQTVDTVKEDIQWVKTRNK